MKINKIRKFLVAAAGVAVAFGLLDDGTAQDIVGVLTVVLTYLIPND